MIKVRRIYDPEEPGEGYRVLVDRLWPRGISREEASWHEWMKEISPGNELRKWYGHDPSRWESFKAKYKQELSSRHDLLLRLKNLESTYGTLTLLYSSKEHEINNAVALREFLLQPDD
ncbi:MAG: DUF488 family protein [Bacteroidota bacterium]|jgi:uncharacterized protein YeaO (DUF488 family)|nr:DUF488 family protein [Bacteroidota bacterium]